MQTQALEREFLYNGAKLTDPSAAFTLEQVRDFYANTYPEIVNAEIEGPKIVGNKNIFTFRRAVGTKGSGAEALKTQVTANGRTYIAGVGVGPTSVASDPDVRSKIEAVLGTEKALPPAIRAYLQELDRFASAHACPLLDEEIAFVGALFARYAS